MQPKQLNHLSLFERRKGNNRKEYLILKPTSSSWENHFLFTAPQILPKFFALPVAFDIFLRGFSRSQIRLGSGMFNLNFHKSKSLSLLNSCLTQGQFCRISASRENYFTFLWNKHVLEFHHRYRITTNLSLTGRYRKLAC